MSDLRTRIAQVLFSRFGKHLGYADAPWDGVEQQSWLEDADAVIRELDSINPISYGPGENRYRYCCPICGDFWFDHSGLMQRFALSHSRSHRTDWKAADE